MLKTFCAMITLATPALAEPLRIGTEPDYAPYIFSAPDGTLTGFDKDLGDAICTQAGFECIWTTMPFADLVGAVADGTIDIAISGMADTPTRRELVDFSLPYRPDLGNVAAFAGMSLGLSAEGLLAGVQIGTVQAEYLAEIGHPHRTYIDLSELEAALRRGEVQVIFAGYGNLQHLIDTTAPDLRIVEAVEVPNYPTAIAISRAIKGLKDRIDAVIAEMGRNGQLDELENRWFPEGLSL
jgi:polar amino acid transport system substrate-binding protein